MLVFSGIAELYIIEDIPHQQLSFDTDTPANVFGVVITLPTPGRYAAAPTAGFSATGTQIRSSTTQDYS